jgi:hypothetical protein
MERLLRDDVEWPWDLSRFPMSSTKREFREALFHLLGPQIERAECSFVGGQLSICFMENAAVFAIHMTQDHVFTSTCEGGITHTGPIQPWQELCPNTRKHREMWEILTHVEMKLK